MWHTPGVGMTTIKIPAELRDRLARIAVDHYDRSTLADTVERLVEEHEEQSALDAYERLRSDEREWASYLNEAAQTDNVAGDWLRQDRSA
jgi:predicted DNA-binding protein